MWVYGYIRVVLCRDRDLGSMANERLTLVGQQLLGVAQASGGSSSQNQDAYSNNSQHSQRVETLDKYTRRHVKDFPQSFSLCLTNATFPIDNFRYDAARANLANKISLFYLIFFHEV